MDILPAFHHIGCAVVSIDKTAERYRRGLGLARRSKPVEVSSQSVRVSFLELGPSSYLELVEPIAPNSSLDAYVGTGFYHLCFLTKDITAAIARMAPSFVVFSEFSSEAFAGRRCAFAASGQGHLVELAEMDHAEFRALFEASLI